MRRISAAVLLALAICPLSAHADRAAARKFMDQASEAMKRNAPWDADAAYTKAIEADPAWMETWFARGDLRRFFRGMENEALTDFNHIIATENASANPSQEMLYKTVLSRMAVLTELERFEEALQAADEFLKKSPSDFNALQVRALARAGRGDVDGALEDAQKALKSQPNALQIIPEFRRLQGDWTMMEAEARKLKALGPDIGSSGWRFLTIALVELGRTEEAEAAARDAAGTFQHSYEGESARGYLMSTPSMPKTYDVDGALKLMDREESDLGQKPYITARRARALFLAGRYGECVTAIESRFKSRNFDSRFWLGASLWKLERFAEAKAALADARRLNTYFMAHAKRIPGLETFAAAIDAEIAGEVTGGAERRKLGFELATHLLTVGEIETLVRRYRFAQAVEEYDRLQATLASPLRKAEVAERTREVKAMAGALESLVKNVNAGKAKLSVKIAKQDLKIVKSDDRAFEFTMTKGSGKFPWAYLDPWEFYRIAHPQASSAEQRFALGILMWDLGDEEAAQKGFEAPVKAEPSLAELLDALIARKRGIGKPKGGFVLHKGRYVTPEEKANLEKGLVRFRGNWVTPADREKLAKGQVKVADKWVVNDEKALLAAGFRKWKDQWMAAEDYRALRGKWENAWEVETPHYKIRSNESEEFTATLAEVIEAAYADMKEFYQGREPRLAKGKMTIFAYRNYEGFRTYCQEVKAEAQLNAGGFAASDTNVVVAWNRMGSTEIFLQTLVHEAAHLYFYRIAAPKNLASWHAEAMATWFEGFQHDGKAWVFHHVPESRLPFVREAMKAKMHIPLSELLAGDALTLINNESARSLLFFAECWSLNYFLTKTSNPVYRNAYLEYRKAVEDGSAESLLKFFPDPGALETDWIEFISAM